MMSANFVVDHVCLQEQTKKPAPRGVATLPLSHLGSK